MMRVLHAVLPLLFALVPTAGPALAQAPAPASEGGGAAAPVPAGAPQAMSLIDRGDLRAHTTHLASDELGGRYTGSEGLQKAAEYIAGRFDALGLLPLGDKAKGGAREFYQRYPLRRTYLDPEATFVAVGEEKMTGGFAVVPGKKGRKVAVRGELVFCGDGSPDEIPKGSFKRRIPVVLLGERAGAPAQGRGMRALQRAAQVQRELERRGARVVLLCLNDEDSAVADWLNVGALLPDKPLLEFGNSKGRPIPSQNLAQVFVGRPLTQRLLAHMGVDPAGGAQQASREATGEVALSVVEDGKFAAVNVVAHLPGSHKKLAQEALVFSAHMDHMGTRLDGDVFNGADDNASGTAALLEIAEAFARGPAPKRSVIFLAVSGEELGLWGSEHFAEEPTWKLQKIVANVNIDMIGRATELSGEKAIAVTPTHRHPQYSTLVHTSARLARELGLDLTDGDRYYERSDQYHFARKKIPVVLFSDGEHEDYHKVTDHADKLDYVKMESVARLAFWTGWETAEAPRRPSRIGTQADW